MSSLKLLKQMSAENHNKRINKMKIQPKLAIGQQLHKRQKKKRKRMQLLYQWQLLIKLINRIVF